MHATVIIPPEDLHLATKWLTELSVRLQRAQQTLYTACRSIINKTTKRQGQRYGDSGTQAHQSYVPQHANAA